MEVHHHGHNPAEPHHKKNWKSYFWEFSMLFLAVFCSYLAEYRLEHKIEKDNGKQYLYSFYEDLITDSSHFNQLISGFEEKVSVLNSMAPCYDSLLKGRHPKNCLAQIMEYSKGFMDMTHTDRTLAQLKNAGGLRLLEKEDADSILLYDNLLRSYKTEETTGLQKVQYDLRETWTMLRDFGRSKNTPNLAGMGFINGNNKELINKYFNQLSIYLNYCKAQIDDLKRIKDKNIRLIGYFKEKYHYQ